MVFDPWYFLFIIPGFLLSIWAQSKVKGNFEKYSKVRNGAGLTVPRVEGGEIFSLPTTSTPACEGLRK